MLLKLKFNAIRVGTPGVSSIDKNEWGVRGKARGQVDVVITVLRNSHKTSQNKELPKMLIRT